MEAFQHQILTAGVNSGRGGTGTPAPWLWMWWLSHLQPSAVVAEEPAKDDSISAPGSSGLGRRAKDLMSAVAPGEF